MNLTYILKKSGRCLSCHFVLMRLLRFANESYENAYFPVCFPQSEF